ncbi:hypothetical protein CKAH01_13800 [Colletotrichum kahawae]|uniref:Uncharacterized protein n=1 Tax=Colletotrichum kahawae TaxID=34407 RepID=A0AAD9YM73_COLKA|nr:hypothetical protein CKAH01_13800 [Colletotrichum kahawae]
MTGEHGLLQPPADFKGLDGLVGWRNTEGGNEEDGLDVSLCVRAKLHHQLDAVVQVWSLLSTSETANELRVLDLATPLIAVHATQVALQLALGQGLPKKHSTYTQMGEPYQPSYHPPKMGDVIGTHLRSLLREDVSAVEDVLDIDQGHLPTESSRSSTSSLPASIASTPNTTNTNTNANGKTAMPTEQELPRRTKESQHDASLG